MSEFKQSETLPASGLTTGFRAAVAGVVSRATERWLRGRAAATLHRLDDSQLEDIGISRNDISLVVADLIPSNTKTSL